MSDEKPVRFRVLDETGAPVEGAFVQVLRSTVAFPEIALVTDENGVVQLSLPEGKFVIGADASGERHVKVELNSGENGLEEDVILTVRSAR